MFRGLLIKDKPGVIEWLEGNVVLPRATSPNAPGRFSTSRMPYLREPLESIRDEGLEHIYWCFGTQSGKTMSLLMAMAYFIHNDPAPMLWALPTAQLAKSFSKARLQPLISKNDILAKHKKRDPDAFTFTDMILDNMELYMVGVREPSNLSQRPIMRCVMDEEAKYEHESKEEAHPVDLIEERTKSFPRHLILHASTPSSEDNYYWTNFMTTDMRHYFMPCPHCAAMIEFVFSRETVQWDREEKLKGAELLDHIEKNAYYVCQECRGHIYDHQKIKMMEHGEWWVTNEEASSSRRGYHLNSLYSPYVTFGQMAKKFWEANNDLFKQNALHNFKNGWEALPYTAYEVKVNDDAVRKLAGDLGRGTLPGEYYYIVVCYDPGQTETHWVATAIGQGGEKWVIDWGTILGIETLGEVKGIGYHFESLEWDGVKPNFGIIDSGDFTNKVYNECYRYWGKLYPSKGAPTSSGTWTTTPIKSHQGLNLFLYVDRTVKLELYLGSIQKREEPLLHLPWDVSGDLIFGLSGQQLIKPKDGGLSVWKKLPADHFGDCVKLACVSWWINRSSYESVVNED